MFLVPDIRVFDVFALNSEGFVRDLDKARQGRIEPGPPRTAGPTIGLILACEAASQEISYAPKIQALG